MIVFRCGSRDLATFLWAAAELPGHCCLFASFSLIALLRIVQSSKNEGFACSWYYRHRFMTFGVECWESNHERRYLTFLRPCLEAIAAVSSCKSCWGVGLNFSSLLWRKPTAHIEYTTHRDWQHVAFWWRITVWSTTQKQKDHNSYWGNCECWFWGPVEKSSNKNWKHTKSWKWKLQTQKHQ